MSHAQHAGCRWFEQVWNQRDPAAIDSLTSPTFVAHGADGVDRSPAAFHDFYELFVTAIPDLRVEVLNCVEGGGMSAMQWRATGTHTGALPGWPPTGLPVVVEGLSLTRMEQGLFVEAWDRFDMKGLMLTMNAPVPAPAN